jgi:hypothetical protein
MCVNIAPGGEVSLVEGGPGSPLGTCKSYIVSSSPGVLVECIDDNGNPSFVRLLSFFPSDGSTVVTSQFCEEVAVPPPPPTPEEAWRAVPSPEPAISINPVELGATGIETWLWGATAESVSVSVTVRGYTVTGTATPTQWRWNMGGTAGTSNPAPELRAGRPGSAADPAVRYTYETKGTYRLTHEVVWSGSFTVSGWGLAGLTLDAGVIIVTSSRDYPVAEIRSVRLSPAGSG